MKKTAIFVAIILSLVSFTLVQGETSSPAVPSLPPLPGLPPLPSVPAEKKVETPLPKAIPITVPTTTPTAQTPALPAPIIVTPPAAPAPAPTAPVEQKKLTVPAPVMPKIELPQITPKAPEVAKPITSTTPVVPAITSAAPAAPAIPVLPKTEAAPKKDQNTDSFVEPNSGFKIYDPSQQFKQPSLPPIPPKVEVKPAPEAPKIDDAEQKKKEAEEAAKQAELEKEKLKNKNTDRLNALKEERRKKILQIISQNYDFQKLSTKIYKAEYNKENIHLPTPLPENYYQQTAFALISKPDEDMSFLRGILEQFENVNDIIDEYGNNVLHQAVAYNRLDIVRMLIGKGADPALANKYDVTPLAIARNSGNASMYNALLTRIPVPAPKADEQYLFNSYSAR